MFAYKKLELRVTQDLFYTLSFGFLRGGSIKGSTPNKRYSIIILRLLSFSLCLPKSLFSPQQEQRPPFLFSFVIFPQPINPNLIHMPKRAVVVDSMENILGLLRIHVIRGINLAVRDVVSSDPYVIVRMGKQKLKTRVVKKNINPEWNEDLTLSISDPNSPIKIVSYLTYSFQSIVVCDSDF
ncbi:OLC1v1010626C1 [Oldenlandia corymbosa var. corymbosa]|uniref:OLC1v1010626C1 n=1 Tax=Oldenlandia corymbosa var. corymbosa TaxID=529605 RepID=A0AAV1DRP7_OLDCO|nr:OLC1v1010626C1 [Oldenlandia corymbosa var. corymbosa]